jgi:hypothetical protein
MKVMDEKIKDIDAFISNVKKESKRVYFKKEPDNL